MTFIVKTATGFPPHYYSQEDLIGMLREVWADNPLAQRRIGMLHRNMRIKGRYLAMPIDWYKTNHGFGASNDIYQKVALSLGKDLLSGLVENTIRPEDISLIGFTTITGLSVPSMDARLMNLIPFSAHTKRMPLFGLGCLGGAAGLARIDDYLIGHPAEAAILLSIELCSLTLQKDDLTVANLVSTGLFGDGAAAVLLAGAQHELSRPGLPQIVDTLSVTFPDTEGLMGYEIRDSGFKMVLGANVDEVIRAGLRSELAAFLHKHSIRIDEIRHWLVHPGGPRILEAMQEVLELPRNALQLSWESLEAVGNISSASILTILDTFMRECVPNPDDYGLAMAFGPGFSAEFLLLQW